MGSDPFHQPSRLFKVPSNLALHTARAWAFTASLGHLFTCLTTLWVKSSSLKSNRNSDPLLAHWTKLTAAQTGNVWCKLTREITRFSEFHKAEGDSLNSQLFMNKYIYSEGGSHKTMGWQWLVIWNAAGSLLLALVTHKTHSLNSTISTNQLLGNYWTICASVPLLILRETCSIAFVFFIYINLLTLCDYGFL